MKRILIIFFIIFSIYLLFFDPAFFQLFPFMNHANQVEITNKIEKIKIVVNDVSTKIIPENRKDLKADLNGKAKLSVKRSGEEVEVTVKKIGFGRFLFHDKTNLNIYIPKDYERKMDIDVGSGNLEFSGGSKTERMKLRNLSLDLGSGNMKLKNLDIKDFRYDGASGNGEIYSLAVQSGSIDISSGSLLVKDYNGGLGAEISSGYLEAQMDKLTDFMDIEVGSGEVNLDLPDNAGFTLHGKVRSGNISCDFPLKDKKRDKSNINGIHGNGEHQVNLKVSSGNINIY
ncbi:DUF4097 family beta strand repeat-containing protein [Bacillus methanolicus]|uniref:DUF4097 domain-containing protein n=1 Tax=Bacillus methanolicus (strain MGA3 / ATCC 53907) TaxID=796606 RepID=I3E314_BACMM|nr:DUF4097 family beta strand repeat-containing protein [Bacillus methanolicus]AIE59023.1 hypothetical protein BMMGA3_02795 [Bacillus methanolicus MGA3]EIJ80885.1 hypothetical protein MGA3_11310 [Bacillus methanolicus MGA3]